MLPSTLGQYVKLKLNLKYFRPLFGAVHRAGLFNIINMNCNIKMRKFKKKFLSADFSPVYIGGNSRG